MSSTNKTNYSYTKSEIDSMGGGTSLSDAISQKANDSDVVHKSGNESIGGVKTFSNLRTHFGRDISCYSTRKYGRNLNPTATAYQYINFSGNTVSDGQTNDWSGGYIEQVVNTDGSSRGRWFIQDTSENPVGIELFANGDDRQFRPYQNGNTDLGTSTKKWKTINGINPGALSLPSVDFVDLDVTNFVLDGDTGNRISVPFDCWLNIRIENFEKYFIRNTTIGATYSKHLNAEQLQEWIVIPVPKDTNMYISIKCTQIVMRAYKCLGNV